MGVVLVTALAAGSFFSNHLSTVRNLTKVSSCKAALDSQLAYMRQFSAAPLAMPWTRNAGGPTIETFPNGYTDAWLDDAVRLTPLAGQDLMASTGAPSGRALRSVFLQQSSVGLVASLYNNVPNICTGPVAVTSIGAKSGHTAFTADTEVLKDLGVTIQIEPFDLVSGAALGCGARWARPRGVMEPQLAGQPATLVTFPPDVDASIGYRVHLRGTYTNGPTNIVNCDASEDFRYPVDRALQRISVILNAYEPAVEANSVTPASTAVAGVPRPQCSHTLGATPATLKLGIGFRAGQPIEPGTVFLCRDTSRQMNPNWCPGAPNGAAMQGQNYNVNGALNAPWVPCDQVSACGIAPASVTFTQATAREARYELNYRSVDGSTPDGLWGCDIKMDVATVDTAGNFRLLSQENNPLVAGVNADTTLKYYQPTDCYKCYKKKPRNWGAIVAIAIGFGAIGLLAACGMMGACGSKGYRFLGHQCFDKYPGNAPGDKYYCRKVRPNNPAWWTAPGVRCPARTVTYAGHPSMSYTLPQSGDDEVVEDSATNVTTGVYCEAQAICSNGNWVGAPDDMGGVSPIENCGRAITERRLDISGLPPGSAAPASGPKQCLVVIPDGVAYPLMTPSDYGSYQVCPPSITGQGSNVLCSYSINAVTGAVMNLRYPPDALTGAASNTNPSTYFYFENLTPLDQTLPSCGTIPP